MKPATISNHQWRTKVLHAATAIGNVDLAGALIASGVDTSARDNRGRTLVYTAAHNGHVNVVRLLLEAGADCAARGPRGWTALHVASNNGHSEVVKTLLLAEAPIDLVSDDELCTPLSLASQSGYVNVAKLLLEKGAAMAPNKDGHTPLHTAALLGNYEMIETLIEGGPEMSAYSASGPTVLQTAIGLGKMALNLLVGNSASVTPNMTTETPLHLAAARGHAPCARLLIERGASIMAVDFRNWTPLHVACQQGHIDVVRLLLRKGAKMSAGNVGETPLHLAAGLGHASVVEELLKAGADMSAGLKPERHTPLHLAAQRNQAESARVLLKHGADMEAMAILKIRPLHMAFLRGSHDVVRVLLEHGADPNAVAWDERNLIHIAAENGSIELVRLLLDHGSNLSVANRGFTPIQLAAVKGHVQLVKLLTEKHADLNIAKNDGRPPLDPLFLSVYIIIAKEKRYEKELKESSAPVIDPENDPWLKKQEHDTGQTSPRLANASCRAEEGASSELDIQYPTQGTSRPFRTTNPQILCDVCRGVFQKGIGKLNINGTRLMRKMARVSSDTCNAQPPKMDTSTNHRPPDRSVQFIHHLSVRSLASASNQGCYICKVLWNRVGFRKRQQLMYSESLKTSDQKRIEPITMCGLLDYSAMFPDPGKPEDGGPVPPQWMVSFIEEEDMYQMTRGITGFPFFRLVPISDVDQADAPIGIGHATNSPESLAFATRKFQDCIQNHKQCKSTSSGWVPSRLISLERLDEDGVVSLVSGNTKPDHYCTLSHSWGGQKVLKLTKSNLDSFQRGIREPELPKTFRDSFLVAGKLGIRYIWIDSLCIIQDDPDDWLAEASQMHQIYSNSLCNINATRSKDPSGGLFTTRDPVTFEPCEVEIPWLGGGGVFRVINEGAWDDQVMKAPLNTRAWVVQEHLLAPKHLHFSGDQIFWECLETTAAEQFPDKLPEAIQLTGQPARRQLHRCKPAIKGAAHSRELLVGWSDIVTRYTSSQLSHWTDRVIAFSGIVHKYEDVFGGTCKGGIWRDNIAHDLLWHVQGGRQGNGDPSERPKSYRAPSFSWMCIEGTIYPNDDRRGESLVQVVSMTIEESRGMITSGQVRLKGMLRQVRLGRTTSSVWGIWQPRFCHRKPELGWSISMSSTALMDTEEEYDDTYFCILISATFMNDWTAGLILRETGRSKGEFSRIGLLQCMGEDKELIQYEYGGEESFPCEDYDRVEKRHTISIV